MPVVAVFLVSFFVPSWFRGAVSVIFPIHCTPIMIDEKTFKRIARYACDHTNESTERMSSGDGGFSRLTNQLNGV